MNVKIRIENNKKARLGNAVGEPPANAVNSYGVTVILRLAEESHNLSGFFTAFRMTNSSLICD